MFLFISALISPMKSRMEVVLPVKIIVSGVFFHHDSSTDITYMMMAGNTGVFCHLDLMIALYRIIILWQLSD